MEDLEVLVTPVKHKQPAPPEEQPEVPTQTGDINVPDKEVEKSKTTEETKMDKLMEMFLEMNKNLESKIEGVNKKMDSTQEENKSTSKKLNQDLNKKMDDNNQSTKEDLNGINKNIESKLEENGKKLEELKEDNHGTTNTNMGYQGSRAYPQNCLLYTSRCV